MMIFGTRFMWSAGFLFLIFSVVAMETVVNMETAVNMETVVDVDVTEGASDWRGGEGSALSPVRAPDESEPMSKRALPVSRGVLGHAAVVSTYDEESIHDEIRRAQVLLRGRSAFGKAAAALRAAVERPRVIAASVGIALPTTGYKIMTSDPAGWFADSSSATSRLVFNVIGGAMVCVGMLVAGYHLCRRDSLSTAERRAIQFTNHVLKNLAQSCCNLMVRLPRFVQAAWGARLLEDVEFVSVMNHLLAVEGDRKGLTTTLFREKSVIDRLEACYAEPEWDYSKEERSKGCACPCNAKVGSLSCCKGVRSPDCCCSSKCRTRVQPLTGQSHGDLRAGKSKWCTCLGERAAGRARCCRGKLGVLCSCKSCKKGNTAESTGDGAGGAVSPAVCCACCRRPPQVWLVGEGELGDLRMAIVKMCNKIIKIQAFVGGEKRNVLLRGGGDATVIETVVSEALDSDDGSSRVGGSASEGKRGEDGVSDSTHLQELMRQLSFSITTVQKALRACQLSLDRSWGKKSKKEIACIREILATLSTCFRQANLHCVPLEEWGAVEEEEDLSPAGGEGSGGGIVASETLVHLRRRQHLPEGRISTSVHGKSDADADLGGMVPTGKDKDE